MTDLLVTAPAPVLEVDGEVRGVLARLIVVENQLEPDLRCITLLLEYRKRFVDTRSYRRMKADLVYKAWKIDLKSLSPKD